MHVQISMRLTADRTNAVIGDVTFKEETMQTCFPALLNALLQNLSGFTTSLGLVEVIRSLTLLAQAMHTTVSDDAASASASAQRCVRGCG